MRIVNKILLKIWEKIKINKFLKFLILEKLCWKLETNMYIVEKMRLINDRIRNFKKEKIF